MVSLAEGIAPLALQVDGIDDDVQSFFALLVWVHHLFDEASGHLGHPGVDLYLRFHWLRKRRNILTFRNIYSS
jgi:hypothetical protein